MPAHTAYGATLGEEGHQHGLWVGGGGAVDPHQDHFADLDLGGELGDVPEDLFMSLEWGTDSPSVFGSQAVQEQTVSNTRPQRALPPREATVKQESSPTLMEHSCEACKRSKVSRGWWHDLGKGCC